MLIRESLILLIAVIVPGGMLVYFAWKGYKKYKNKLSREYREPQVMINNTKQEKLFKDIEKLINNSNLATQLYVDHLDMTIVVETKAGCWRIAFEEKQHDHNK